MNETEQNEGLLLRQLSDVLTGGAAGTWDEVLHAVGTLQERVRELRAELESAVDRERGRGAEVLFWRDAESNHALKAVSLGRALDACRAEMHAQEDRANAAERRLNRIERLLWEWQEARKPVGLSAPGVGVVETYQRAVKRMAAADEALAAFDLDAPEDDEAETCETCQQPITGQVVRSWDDVPLCEECAEPDRDAPADNLDGPAGGALVGRSAPTESTGTSLREELTEIIRWRFKTADGGPLNGPVILKRAQEIADEIAPMIEEATGER